MAQRPNSLRPAEVTESSDWWGRAGCRDENPELFFPVGTQGPAKLQEQKALSVCWSCPVATECLADALATADPYGVRGGFTEGERRSMLRNNPPARPPAKAHDLTGRRRTRTRHRSPSRQASA